MLSGSAPQQLTNISGAENPAWSSDGQELVFDVGAKNSADLFITSYPHGPPRQITSNASKVVENNFWEMQADWAPDGNSLIYVSDRGRLRTGTLDPSVWRLTLATKARVQLSGTNNYTGGVANPHWRPHPTDSILFTSWAYDPQTLVPFAQLLLQDIQTSRQHVLTAPGNTEFQASWSPDGNSIAFVRRANGRDDIWIAPVNTAVSTATTTSTPLASDAAAITPAHLLVQGTNAYPVWSPDGRAIAYLALKNGSFDLFTQALTADQQASGEPKQLTQGWNLDGNSSISWSS